MPIALLQPTTHLGISLYALLSRAAAVLTGAGYRRGKLELREEEALLDEVLKSIPPYWAHSVETMASGDVIRVTQAARLHCAEQFVRMLIHRHRFSEMVAERMHNHVPDSEQSEAEIEAMRAAHSCSLQIISSHLHIAAKGLMTYCEYWSPSSSFPFFLRPFGECLH